MRRSIAGAAAVLAMVAGCGHGGDGVPSAAAASSLASEIAHASCENAAPLGTAIGEDPSPSPAPGDASPVPTSAGSFPADAVRWFVGFGLGGVGNLNVFVVLRSPHPAAPSGSSGQGLILEVAIDVGVGDMPFSANDFSVQGSDGRWYAGVPARVLDPGVQQSLSQGVVPAGRTVDGYVAFDVPGSATTLKFIGVGVDCNPTETWPLG